MSISRDLRIFLCKINLRYSLLLILIITAFITLSGIGFNNLKFLNLNKNVYRSIDTESDGYVLPEETFMSESEIWDMSQKESNIAINYWLKWKNYSYSQKWTINDAKSCKTELPSPHELKFNNIYWQSVINNEKLNLYIYIMLIMIIEIKQIK